jgi:selenocysteine lyase/cysteine desulfurase
VELTRKEVLAGAALLAAGCGGHKKPAARGWDGVRAQFALAPGKRHFDGFLFASHPRPVREAIGRHRAGLDAGAAAYVHANQERLDAAVATEAARYLGVPARELAFTDSTTMGLGLVYGGVKLRPGDEVLTTEHDFYATHEALALRAERDGVTVRRVSLYGDPARASADAMIARLRAAITRRTRVLALTWVHSGTGVKLPLRALADALGPNRPLLVVDAVHALGAVPDEIGPELCDVLIFGTHKWLSGPRGTGVVWSHAWDRMTPIIPTFTDSPFTPGGYHSFEHRWALADAFRFQSSLGRAPVAARIEALATRLKDGLAPHVTLVTPRSPAISAGLVCFDVAGFAAAETVRRLAAKGILASVTPYRVTHARLGTSLHVDEDDVDAAVAGVGSLAP